MAGGYDSANSTNNTIHEHLVGWTATSRDRGTLDIIWSSCVTIFLCSWVSTFPNTGSPKDKWYHSLYDKFSLALISILGPDCLFRIAYGQFSSTRRSVKVRRKIDDRSSKERQLTVLNRSRSAETNIFAKARNGPTLTLSSPTWVASISPVPTSLTAFPSMPNNCTT
jgi:hypothetical protein